MHQRRLNEWTAHVVIEPEGPLLIKSGLDSSADPTLPSMSFVRSRHPRSGEPTIYLPGSSLKGALRSHVERIIRTVHGAQTPLCCDPLGDQACGKKIERMINNKTLPPGDTATQYKELCLACRIFGHTTQASHLRIADAFPLQAVNRLPMRHQVAIDRLSGGVQNGPFDLEVAQGIQFETRLMLFNFECWQLGLLALALRDLAESRLMLGYGKSRGLGRVKAYVTEVELAYPGQLSADGTATVARGVGSLASGLAKGYGYVDNDQIPLPPGGLAQDAALRPAVRFGAQPAGNAQEAYNQVRPLLAAMVPAWAAYRRADKEA